MLFATAITFVFPALELEGGGYLSTCGAYIPKEQIDRYNTETNTMYLKQGPEDAYFLVPLANFYEIKLCFKGMFHAEDLCADPIMKEAVKSINGIHTCMGIASAHECPEGWDKNAVH